MVNTLGLDDDMDDVEIVELVESAFDVEFTKDEVAPLVNVGQMYDLLLRKVPTDVINRKCATAMAFYRLKRALNDLEPREKLTPGTDLSQYRAMSVKRLFKQLGQDTGLKMPNPSWSTIGGWIFMLLFFGVFLGFPLVAIASIISHTLGGPQFPLFLVRPAKVVWFVSLPLAWLVGYLDTGSLTKNCRTLGDLAELVAPLNFGYFAKHGALTTGPAIWNALVQVLSSYNDFPANQISRETVFLESQLKRAA